MLALTRERAEIAADQAELTVLENVATNIANRVLAVAPV